MSLRHVGCIIFEGYASNYHLEELCMSNPANTASLFEEVFAQVATSLGICTQPEITKMLPHWVPPSLSRPPNTVLAVQGLHPGWAGADDAPQPRLQLPGGSVCWRPAPRCRQPCPPPHRRVAPALFPGPPRWGRLRPIVQLLPGLLLCLPVSLCHGSSRVKSALCC